MLRSFVSWLLVTGLYAVAGLVAFAVAAVSTASVLEAVTGAEWHNVGYAVGAAFGVAGILACRDAARGGL